MPHASRGGAGSGGGRPWPSWSAATLSAAAARPQPQPPPVSQLDSQSVRSRGATEAKMRGAQVLLVVVVLGCALAAARTAAHAADADAHADTDTDTDTADADAVAAAAPVAAAGSPSGSSGGVPPCEGGAGLPCVSKCCPRGQVFMADKQCHDSNLLLEVYFLNNTEPAPHGTFAIAYGDPCTNDKYVLVPEEEAQDAFELLADGTLHVPGTQPAPFPREQYCMETWMDADANTTATLTFLCFPVSKAEQGSQLHRIFYPLGLLVSVPFLLATVCVYQWIRELRDLHGRALCCYAGCMAVAYLALAIVQLSGQGLGQTPCTIFAYIIQFSFVMCFFWLNILCIDVCWYILAFTGAIGYYPCLPQWQFWETRGWLRVEDENIDRYQEQLFARKVFYGYTTYACGLPIILLIIVIALDLNPALPISYLKPSMGDLVCWFSNEQGALHYFYGPIGCILAVNVVLFCITMYRVAKHNWNSRGPHRKPKQRARMCLVLFLAMGISWIMEIISWAVGGPPFVWAVTDAFNVLQGVVIFIIFVMEPRVRVLVCKKLSKRRSYFSNY
ncbi:hypothetical protein R5R35_008034 [Gryllus longicercus]|uniref:G-protein coupled receptors family 2 profile 2 domain-containing protein n=1 Tax=Gryllus longicercus TaxID=2509291 RepID=A0AAN9VU28_9ORTH